MSGGIVYRQLRREDAETYRVLRLEALQRAPEAFGSSFEEEREKPVTDFGDRLENGIVLGAFDSRQLVGVAGFYALDRKKTAHRGAIWGVYVDEAHRGQGIAGTLMDRLLAYAATRVEQVHLAVVVGNAPALRLYERLGFTVYGTEPRALRIDGRDYDELLMVKRF